ncbi:MAG: lipopolysaccharide biosynthesis protein [Planctomycetales bacterium]|nr:lipopolysaccharide biosynthesis protein [Planctomycetales bacterium]
MTADNNLRHATDTAVSPARRAGWWTRTRSALLRPGTLAVVDQGIVSFANFATNALVARSSSEEDFGVYFLALSLLYFVRGIQEQLVSSPYTIYCHRRDTGKLAVYTGSSVVHQWIVAGCLVATIGIGAFAARATLGPGHLLTDSLFVLVAVAPFFLFREFIRKLVFAHLQFSVAIWMDGLVAAFQLSSLLVLWKLNRLTVVNAYLIMAVACGIPAAAWLLTTRVRWKVRRNQLWRHWTENWRFGRWALFTHVIGCSTPYIMPWVVASFHGEATTAALGACQTVVGIANMFVTGVSNFLSPRTAKSYAEGGRASLIRTLVNASVLFSITLGSFTIVTACIGNWLPATIMGPQYQGLGTVMLFLAASQWANALGMVAGNGLWAMDHPRLNLSADAMSLGFVIGLAVILVPHYEALGAAMSWLIGNLITSSWRWIILIRLLRQHRHRELGVSC